MSQLSSLQQLLVQQLLALQPVPQVAAQLGAQALPHGAAQFGAQAGPHAAGAQQDLGAQGAAQAGAAQAGAAQVGAAQVGAAQAGAQVLPQLESQAFLQHPDESRPQQLGLQQGWVNVEQAR